MCLTVFSTREMFQLNYDWVEIKYLDAIQNRRWQLFCRCGNAFPQYTLAYASAIATCRHELERLGSEAYIFFKYLKQKKKKMASIHHTTDQTHACLSFLL